MIPFVSSHFLLMLDLFDPYENDPDFSPLWDMEMSQALEDLLR